MTVIASCGHTLREDEGDGGMGWSLAIKSHSREWDRAVMYGVYCTACRDRYMAEGLVLLSEKAERRWLDDEPIPYRLTESGRAMLKGGE